MRCNPGNFGASRERTDLSLERGLAEGRTEDGLVPVAGREAARVVVCGRSAPVALALIAWRTPTSPTCGGAATLAQGDVAGNSTVHP